MTTVIKNGTLVAPGGKIRADLCMGDGKIAEIGADLAGDRVCDASGCLVFPGFIDAHTHLEMPVAGTVTADDFPSGTRAALAGGTTTILDFATQERDGGTLSDALSVWHKRADGRCACDYGFHMAVTRWTGRRKRSCPP
jgi:dihydropyrimidinase